MKSFSILLAIFFLCIKLPAQSNYSFKEYYDALEAQYTTPYVDYTNQFVTGNGISWAMASYINMYKATRDKAYLIKFINHAIKIQKHRQDDLFSPTTHPPKWTLVNDKICGGKVECIYFNSLIISPMAEFVHLVLNESKLYHTILPLNLINHKSANILSYGDLAMWLGARVEETLLHMNRHYFNNDEGIVYEHNRNKEHIADINMQAPYATALLFMGLCDTSFTHGKLGPQYLNLAATIAERYKGNRDINRWPPCKKRVLEYNAAHNSYQWSGGGWGMDCRKDGLKEDISHGAMTISFPIKAYENNTSFFSQEDMARFHNAFTRNIYVSPVKFYNTVYGTDHDMDKHISIDCNGNIIVANGTTNFFWQEVLNWMPVQQFDGAPGTTSPHAYDILVHHCKSIMDGTFTSLSCTIGRDNRLLGGQPFLGLSEVVKAQWERECEDVTFNKRELPYDQDFIVEGILTIDPHAVKPVRNDFTGSFADPVIINNVFLINNNANVNITAETVIIKPGFTATAGTNVTIKAQPCAGKK